MSETPKPEATPEKVAPPVESPAAAEADEAAEAIEAVEAIAAVEAGEAVEADSTRTPKSPSNLSPAAVAALLAENFPALFGAGRALPIKLRIQADIQQRTPGLFSKKALSIFLHRYTTSTAYLKALAVAPHRLDLDGLPAGEVDEVHRQAAAAEAERRKHLFEERRAAEREQHRQKALEERRVQEAQNKARHAARDQAETEARRHRAALLRAFETTTLTRANFCALKGIVEAELDGLLDRAWREREERAQEPPRPAAPRAPRRPPEPTR